jgi:KaiC/GvpD/RAD55 family RecA-like ATPase
MITNDIIKDFKDYGFNLTPVIKSSDPAKDKKPESKNGKWFYDWSESDLLSAKRIGAYHKESRIYDVDFDDKSFNAHKFMSLMPETLTIGKLVNGRPIATHKIYALPEGVETKKYTYPKEKNKGNTIIELLPSTQTIVAGDDRIIINNVKPLMLDPSIAHQYCRLIAAFSELLKNWPEKNIGKRDEAHLRLAGALAKETNIDLNLKEDFVTKLCELTDDQETKNRVAKLQYQEEQHKTDPDKIYGIKSLSDFLNVNLPAFDEIKKKTEVEKKATGLSFLNGHQFVCKDFPEPEYILNPIVAKQQIRQVFAKAGTGKTLYCIHEAAHLASGYDFLHFKHNGNKTPVLYVEGEMDSSSIKKRVFDIQEYFEHQNKVLNMEYLFFATLAIQKDMHFESLTNEVGRLNVEIAAKEVEKLTGKKPVIYLDNITALTVMQEKEGAEWVLMMQWLSKLRNKGYHVTFLHHPTKTGETASGSNIKERSIDIDMKLSTPDEKTIIEEYEEGHTQMTIEFLKWREHMNTYHSKTRTALINRANGNWFIFPKLSKTQRIIWQKLKEGKDPKTIIDEGKGKEGLSKANVYKTIKILEGDNLYEANKQSPDREAKDIC